MRNLYLARIKKIPTFQILNSLYYICTFLHFWMYGEPTFKAYLVGKKNVWDRIASPHPLSRKLFSQKQIKLPVSTM